jgi:hypothetical protein
MITPRRERLIDRVPDSARHWEVLDFARDPEYPSQVDCVRQQRIPWGYFHRPDVMQRLGIQRKEDA